MSNIRIYKIKDTNIELHYIKTPLSRSYTVFLRESKISGDFLKNIGVLIRNGRKGYTYAKDFKLTRFKTIQEFLDTL